MKGRMMKSIEGSPSRTARIAGVFYLLTILMGLFAQIFVAGRIIVDGDAAATATNILVHKNLFQLGFLFYLVELACNVAITVFFYDLLKPAGRSISLLAAAMSLIACAVKTISRLFYLAPVFVLGGHYLSAFTPPQVEALALLCLKVNEHGAGVAMVFFGFNALLKGYLIFRSTFLPRILGVLSALGGLGWLTWLWQPLGYRLLPDVSAVAVLGGVSLIVWLLLFGVNEERWRERAGMTGPSD